MTDVEKDILARFTALDTLVAFLLAKHFRSLPQDVSEQVRASFLGHPHNLRIGMMDAEALQDIAGRIEASLGHILSQAEGLEAHWRDQAGE